MAKTRLSHALYLYDSTASILPQRVETLYTVLIVTEPGGELAVWLRTLANADCRIPAWVFPWPWSLLLLTLGLGAPALILVGEVLGLINERLLEIPIVLVGLTWMVLGYMVLVIESATIEPAHR